MKKALLFFIILAASPAWTATYYVSTTGSDAHSCSITDSAGTNKLTVNAGLGCLSGGDTLIIHSGTYAEAINTTSGTNIPSGTSWTAATTIKAATGSGGSGFTAGYENVILRQPTAAGTSIFIGTTTQHQYIIFEGLDIDNTNGN